MNEKQLYALDVSNTAINLFDGLDLKDSNFDATREVWENEGMGFIELCSTLSILAQFINDELAKRDPQDFPGVFDYEVSTNIGMWLGGYMRAYKRLPEQENIEHMVQVTMDEFFAQGEPVYDEAGNTWLG